jgi:hypothetical protein
MENREFIPMEKEREREYRKLRIFSSVLPGLFGASPPV